MDNIVELHDELVNHTYRHGGYKSFVINDPKRRHIHKASVRDRLLHHAIHRILYPFFDRTFITDSFSCRNNKGLHKAIDRFRTLAYQVSRNHTRTVWVLKCDIKKFFASIDHTILLAQLKRYIPDGDVLLLLENIIASFHTEGMPRIGLPLGNLTSQLFANVYMNVFDQWAKHTLKCKQYVRYADDFIFLSRDRVWLEQLVFLLQHCLSARLHLSLHPDKIIVQTLASGVEFLGWIHFPHHRILRTTTRRRMMRRIIDQQGNEKTVQSYMGMLRHGNTVTVSEEIVWLAWLYS